jgi:hypothetical protein
MRQIDLHTKRLEYGADRRLEFNREYFTEPHLFDYPLNYDCYLCKTCGWHPVTEKVDELICDGCNTVCAKLDTVLDFGMYKGRRLSEVPRDYILFLKRRLLL